MQAVSTYTYFLVSVYGCYLSYKKALVNIQDSDEQQHFLVTTISYHQ